MVTTPALSRVFTSTPDSCETGAVAMAVVPMANRMVPSSCFNLISLSPHAVVDSPPSVHGIPEPLDQFLSSPSLAHQVQTTILPPGSAQLHLLNSPLLSKKSWKTGATT